MPEFLEFLYVFGNWDGLDPELSFSGFRSDTVLSTPSRHLSISGLNRSRLRYQLCYSLKGVAIKEDSGD